MRYFRCEKCGFQFVAGNNIDSREFMICGAFTGNVNDEGTALGCGGKIEEITLEEAMDYE